MNREKMRLLFMILEIACLILAVYIMIKMYTYHQGWDAGVAYAKNNCLHYLSQNFSEV